MRRDVAEEITKLVTECSNTLERSVGTFEPKLEPEDFEHYRRAVAEIIATMVHDILLPIHQQYPELRKY